LVERIGDFLGTTTLCPFNDLDYAAAFVEDSVQMVGDVLKRHSILLRQRFGADPFLHRGYKNPPPERMAEGQKDALDRVGRTSQN
jgi:hypothetical protein